MSFDLQFQVGLRSQFQRRPLLGAQPHAIGDVVLGDDQILAGLVLAPDDDMAVRMAGVEVIDRDPIEPRSEVFLHLAHHVAGEGAKIGQPVAVLGRDDEAKLMPVLSPALHKLAAIRRVGLWPIEPTPFSFPVVPSRCK